MKVTELSNFALGVWLGVYENTDIFVHPPYTKKVFKKLISDFIIARSKYKKGGSALKSTYIKALNSLMTGLDDLAGYVNKISNQDKNIIISSGFKPTKKQGSKVKAPAQPENILLKQGAAGEILAECESIKTADAYRSIVSLSEIPTSEISVPTTGQLRLNENSPLLNQNGSIKPGEVISVFDFNISRKKRFSGLESGTRYYFYFFATNSNGSSRLSEVRSIICP